MPPKNIKKEKVFFVLSDRLPGGFFLDFVAYLVFSHNFFFNHYLFIYFYFSIRTLVLRYQFK